MTLRLAPDEFPPIPSRASDSHKGTHGTVVVIGGHAGGVGEARMLGAPALAGLAALRAGSGLVKLAVPEPIAGHVLEICPSATSVPLPVDDAGELVPHATAEILDDLLDQAPRGRGAVVLGPGLGTSPAAEQVVYRVVRHAECPVILDADGLNVLAAMGPTGSDLVAPTIMTPHPGEFRRLAAVLNLAGDPTDANQRPDLCAAMARALGCVCVLKGKGTIVSDGVRIWVCAQGHPCLATGGTGDVLAGLLGGLCAQYAPAFMLRGLVPPGSLDLFACAQLGVEAHALAGEQWAQTNAASAGLLAAELAALLPAELERLRG